MDKELEAMKVIKLEADDTLVHIAVPENAEKVMRGITIRNITGETEVCITNESIDTDEGESDCYLASCGLLKAEGSEDLSVEELSYPCPDCGTQLVDGDGGSGVKCPNPSCGYWFCY